MLIEFILWSNFIQMRRSCQRIHMPSTRRSFKCWFILTSRTSRRLPQILHLFGRCCTWIRLPNRNSIQNWWQRWHWQLRRSRRCSRMVSFELIHFLSLFFLSFQTVYAYNYTSQWLNNDHKIRIVIFVAYSIGNAACVTNAIKYAH